MIPTLEALSEFPALDGQTDEKSKSLPIRSDVLEILELSEGDFNEWYNERRGMAQILLKQFELVGSVPHLRYSSEGQKITMGGCGTIRDAIGNLKETIKYLDEIKRVRPLYLQQHTQE